MAPAPEALLPQHRMETRETREIRPSGGYLPMDAEGYVVREASMDHVVPPWTAIVDDIIDAYVTAYGERLVGVYLRGSVPAGHAVPGLSDIDAFGLLQPAAGDAPGRWADVPWADAFNARLRARHEVATSADLAIATFHERLGERAPGVQMVLATQSLCVHGRDVIPALTTRYRPGPAMVLHLPWLAPTLDEFAALSARGTSEDGIRRQCRALMKVMIRSGFELVMAAEQRYTTSLYWCYRSFARHYPDPAAAMERALFLYLNPSADAGAVLALALARELGTWLLAGR